jgi:hypothetical protein
MAMDINNIVAMNLWALRLHEYMAMGNGHK